MCRRLPPGQASLPAPEADGRVGHGRHCGGLSGVVGAGGEHVFFEVPGGPAIV